MGYCWMWDREQKAEVAQLAAREMQKMENSLVDTETRKMLQKRGNKSLVPTASNKNFGNAAEIY